MLLHWWQHQTFSDIQKKVRDYGGADAVHESFRIHRRKTSSRHQKLRAHAGYLLSRSLRHQMQMVKKDAPPLLVVNGLTSRLQLINHKAITLDGEVVPVGTNYMTTQTQKAKPKPQLHYAIFDDCAAPRITKQSHGEFVKVKLGNGSCVYVIYASKNSDCPLLRELYHSCYNDTSNAMEDALDSIHQSAWDPDHAAGGIYLPTGIGFMNTSSPKPFYLQTHRHPQTSDITKALSTIFGSVAKVILNYIPDVYQENDILKRNNEHFCHPPLSSQGHLGWMATQVVVRRVGGGQQTQRRICDKTSIYAGSNVDVVGLHYDSGDLSTMHPLIYIPRGGDNGRGGSVADSELLVD